MEIEAARNMLYKACWLKDNHRPFAKLAAMGKLYCSEVMGRVVSEAVLGRTSAEKPNGSDFSGISLPPWPSNSNL